MRPSKLQTFTVLAAASLLLAACSGSTGPQGATGATGGVSSAISRVFPPYDKPAGYNGPAGAYVSPMIYAPSMAACGNGTVWSGGTLVYYASASRYSGPPGGC